MEKPDQIDAAAAAAHPHFGRNDGLVDNARYGYLAAVEEGDDADVLASFETNVFGLARLTRAVLPFMRTQRAGHVVNIDAMRAEIDAGEAIALAADYPKSSSLAHPGSRK
jgi:NAD(P)-dependent dehydrogenase (short-subunit alcohol dehydrogenase family)